MTCAWSFRIQGFNTKRGWSITRIHDAFSRKISCTWGGSGRLDMVGLSEGGQQSAVSSVKTAQTIEFSVSNGYINFLPSRNLQHITTNHGFLMNHLYMVGIKLQKKQGLARKIPMVFAD
jgi:hypothetical protein